MIDTLPVDISPSFPDPLALDALHLHFALECVRVRPFCPHSDSRPPSQQQHAKSPARDPLSFDARLLYVARRASEAAPH